MNVNGVMIVVTSTCVLGLLINCLAAAVMLMAMPLKKKYRL